MRAFYPVLLNLRFDLVQRTFSALRLSETLGGLSHPLRVTRAKRPAALLSLGIPISGFTDFSRFLIANTYLAISILPSSGAAIINLQ